MGGVVASKAFLPPPPSYDENYNDLIWISSVGEDKVPAIFHKHREAQYTLLFSHGNAEDIGQMQDWMLYLSRILQVNVISYDYKGYGPRVGQIPDEKSVYNDIEAVYNYLIKVENISAHSIILFGRSLGSGPTVHLASQLWKKWEHENVSLQTEAWWQSGIFSSLFCNPDMIISGTHEVLVRKAPPIAGVILQSPISSCIRVVSNALAIIPIDMFVNISKIHFIHSPVAIIHGTVDSVVPYTHGKELFEKCKNGYKLFTLEGAGHNNIECDFMDELINNLVEFMNFLNDYHQHNQKSEEEEEET